MLDAETKRRIDTARDILVGKVPDPKSQVEQITIALIYKFMDDMDAESEELGGNRKFFAGEFAQYGWPKLVRSGLGGHEVLSLYSEAITRMPENPGIPPLFRDIFKNAFLPYNDPETLRAFLKIIDEFKYDHSERLGDAFEYLLSVLGSQGDAGQFRTPRHIIDFIVSIVDPKKDETILDPACGTAGFLISSYKHILKSNTDEKGHSTLTPDEKGKLADNFRGYDISPDMVRLSLVNLYLHGFVAPQIHEYDTLTSEDLWNDYADVVLANPPFMSPKGGIKPHNRFSVKSKRSEVLFVDYMAEHLTPNGRAGIIVPEGIIFQSQNAYKQLRKMLVEEYLVAVISLPAGVFNPYSGVKTSILILDKGLARRRGTIGFFRVESDGFDLGAQRGKIDENDLPQIKKAVIEYLNINGQGMQDKDASESMLNKLTEQGSIQVVANERIAANGEYNLSGERYREKRRYASTYTYVPLNTIAKVIAGNSAPQDSRFFKDGEFPFIRTSDVGVVHRSDDFSESADKVNQEAIDELRLRLSPPGTILFPKSGASTFLNHRVIINEAAYVSSHLASIICDLEKVLPKYLYRLLCQIDARDLAPDQAYPSLRLKEIGNIKIPLPPLEVQREIVAEIEGYQKVIDGARAVVENYRPHITIDPDWPMVELEQVCNFKRGPFGGSLKKEIFVSEGYAIYEQSHAISQDFSSFRYFIDEKKYSEMNGFTVHAGDIIMSCSGTMGRTAIVPDNAPLGIINQALLKLSTSDRVLTSFLKLWMDSGNFQQSIENVAFGAAIRNVASVKILKKLMIPLPPLEIQKTILTDVDAEQALVIANRELIERFEKKIQAAITRVWGE